MSENKEELKGYVPRFHYEICPACGTNSDNQTSCCRNNVLTQNRCADEIMKRVLVEKQLAEMKVNAEKEIGLLKSNIKSLCTDQLLQLAEKDRLLQKAVEGLDHIKAHQEMCMKGEVQLSATWLIAKNYLEEIRSSVGGSK